MWCVSKEVDLSAMVEGMSSSPVNATEQSAEILRCRLVIGNCWYQAEVCFATRHGAQAESVDVNACCSTSVISSLKLISSFFIVTMSEETVLCGCWSFRW